MEVRDQEFRNGVLVREVVRMVPDPAPSPEEQLEARIVAEVERRVAAVRDALAQSGDAKLAAVAADIATRTAATATTPGGRVR